MRHSKKLCARTQRCRSSKTKTKTGEEKNSTQNNRRRRTAYSCRAGIESCANGSNQTITESPFPDYLRRWCDRCDLTVIDRTSKYLLDSNAIDLSSRLIVMNLRFCAEYLITWRTVDIVRPGIDICAVRERRPPELVQPVQFEVFLQFVLISASLHSACTAIAIWASCQVSNDRGQRELRYTAKMLICKARNDWISVSMPIPVLIDGSAQAARLRTRPSHVFIENNSKLVAHTHTL